MTREEAIDVLKHNYPSACFTDLCEAVEIAIQALSAQPERKKGKWIVSHIPDSMLWECNQCGFDCGAHSFNFCPNCGADMKGEKNEIDRRR